MLPSNGTVTPENRGSARGALVDLERAAEGRCAIGETEQTGSARIGAAGTVVGDGCACQIAVGDLDHDQTSRAPGACFHAFESPSAQAYQSVRLVTWSRPASSIRSSTWLSSGAETASRASASDVPRASGSSPSRDVFELGARQPCSLGDTGERRYRAELGFDLVEMSESAVT